MPAVDAVTRLLHVEDNGDDVEYVAAVLKGAPSLYEIDVVSALSDAREALRTTKYDVVLLDLNLPDSQGAETMAALPSLSTDVPIVVCTNDDAPRRAQEALGAAAQDFVPKWGGRADRSRLDTALQHAVVRHQLAAELRRTRKQVVDVLDAASVGLFVMTEAGTVPLMNGRAAIICGGTATDPSPMVLEAVPEVGGFGQVQLPAGRYVALVSNFIDWQGSLARLVTARDVTDQMAADAELQRLADHLQTANTQLSRLVLEDPLTQVSNRRGFARALETELAAARRHGWAMCAALLDCDDFKAVNDKHGHEGGDAALRAVASRAQSALRATDHIARIGGDEFLILLPNAGIWQASRVAERVRLRVQNEPIAMPEGEDVVSVSIGVAQVGLNSESVEDVLKTCRSALAESKSSGKNVVRVHGVPESATDAVRTALRAPLTFAAVKTPIVFLESESVAAVEYACRADLAGFETPRDFFALARDLSIVTETDLCCFDVAFENAQAAPTNVVVWLHVQASTLFEDDEVPRRVAELAKRRRVVVVVNELERLARPEALSVTALRETGAKIALNNVGTNGVTLSALAALAPDAVKLAASVLHQARRDPVGRRTATNLIDILRAAQIDVVAKGVETRRDHTLAKTIGASAAQGEYYRGHTIPQEDRD